MDGVGQVQTLADGVNLAHAVVDEAHSTPLLDGQLPHPIQGAFGHDDLAGQVQALVLVFLLPIFEEHHLSLTVEGRAAGDEGQLQVMVVGQFACFVLGFDEVERPRCGLPLLEHLR